MHCVLGTKPGQPDKWASCDLAKVLVTPKDIEAAPVLPAGGPGSLDNVVMPTYTNFGLAKQDRHLLFDVLPELTRERMLEQSMRGLPTSPSLLTMHYEHADFAEGLKVSMLARVVDLRNANAKGIAFENRRRCIEAFSEPGKPNDTGRPEVQGMYQYA